MGLYNGCGEKFGMRDLNARGAQEQITQSLLQTARIPMTPDRLFRHLHHGRPILELSDRLGNDEPQVS